MSHKYGEKNLNSAIRILVVSHTFPPATFVGGLRIARLCRYLPQHGIEPIVLSVEDRFHEALDYSFSVHEQIRVVRTSSMLTPVDWYRRVKSYLFGDAPKWDSTQKDALDKPFFRRQILALLSLPDECCGWYFAALNAAEKLIREEKFDAIFSSGPPWVSHLIARRLQSRYHLPWIADFRDPWAHLLPEKTGPEWRQRFLERLEDRCLRSADMILCNTERMRQAFQCHYSDLDPSRFRTLTNGYEDPGVPASIERNSKRLFLHLGSIYGLRRIDTFLQAIAELTCSGSLDSGSFRLVFQGSVSPELVIAAQRRFPELVRNACLEFRSRVSWKDGQRLLWSADRLLLFQGNHILQIPAKFYEYLQTGIPIFAVTEEGALTDVLTATHSGLWARPGNPQEIAERFLEVLQLAPHSHDYVQRNLDARFHYRQLAKRFAEWIHDLVGREDLKQAGVGSAISTAQRVQTDKVPIHR
jgi:glycosyltransferase involved in cell wall biosynthesis